MEVLKEPFQLGLDFYREWSELYPNYPAHSSLTLDPEHLKQVLNEFIRRMKGNYPFFHPYYTAQMLKTPHPAALAAYIISLFVNANNHALDGGPIPSEMEKEAMDELAFLPGWQDSYLGHLTSGGTMANLEGLWVARELHPTQAIVYSEHAHYTHARMCSLLRQPHYEIPVDTHGRLDVSALKKMLDSQEDIGTVVATIGTTGLGALDPLDDLLELQRNYNFRIHVDAAYGGYYLLFKEDPENLFPTSLFHAVQQTDSFVVDPHKHGLQPYGCGSILFRDPAVGQLYKHDSPYTYFTSRDLHLGEISLECSRSGAAAAALWLTLKVFPLERYKGMGPILEACRRAAVKAYKILSESPVLVPLTEPMLDIVTFFPRALNGAEQTTRMLSHRSELLFNALMKQTPPVFLSKLKVKAEWFTRLFPHYVINADPVIVLRMVLMKPEHETYIDEILDLVTKTITVMES